jgi:NTP pyrophosphatase (non-canonical NTP hydrolase)
MTIPLTTKVIFDIADERKWQDKKWGIQRHSKGDWLKILVEEVGEVAQAMQKEKNWGKETDSNNLYQELIQVAAVSCAIAEQVREEQEQIIMGSSE